MNTDNTQTTTITVTIEQLGLIAYAARITEDEMRKIARHYEEDEQGAITANITARKLKDLYNMSVSAYQDAVRFAEK
jgi:triosephosphate isomerase